MPSSQDSIEARLRARPDDEELWTIFADDLLRKGDPRGELIALDLAIDRAPAKEQTPLRVRRSALLQAHRHEQLGAIAGCVFEDRWRFGFLRSIEFSGDAEALETLLDGSAARYLRHLTLRAPEDSLLSLLAKGRSLSSIRSLRIGELKNSTEALVRALHNTQGLTQLKALCLDHLELNAASIARLAQAPFASSLESLHLQHNPISDDGVRALLALGPFEQLRSLNLANTGLSENALRSLAGARHLRALRELNLDYNNLSDLGSTFSTAHLRALHSLSLRKNPIELDSLERTLDAGAFRALRSLDLSETLLTADGAAALGGAPQLTELRTLRLFFNAIGDEGLEHLVRAPHLRLLELNVGHNQIGDAGVTALAQADHWKLERLELQMNEFGPSSAIELIEAPQLAGLQTLNLSNSSLPPQWAQALQARGGLQALSKLELGGNALADRGATALAQSSLPRLRTLNLYANRIGPQGAHAIAQAGWIGRLQTLELGQNPLLSAGLQAFQKAEASNLQTLQLDSCGLNDGSLHPLQSLSVPQLEVLSLRDNQLNDPSAVALAKCPWLPQLRALYLDQNEISDIGASALFKAPLQRLEALGLYANALELDLLLSLEDHPILQRAVVEDLWAQYGLTPD